MSRSGGQDGAAVGTGVTGEHVRPVENARQQEAWQSSPNVGSQQN